MAKVMKFFLTVPLVFRKRNYPHCFDRFRVSTPFYPGRDKLTDFPAMFFNISYWYFSWIKFPNPDIKSQLSKASNWNGVAPNLQMLLHMEKSNVKGPNFWCTCNSTYIPLGKYSKTMENNHNLRKLWEIYFFNTA